MDLSGREAAGLLPLLLSSDYILAYDRTRFMPRHPMSLHRVCWLVASILDALAGRDLVDSRALESEDATVRGRAVARAAGWCVERGARRPSDRLQEAVLEAAEWTGVQRDLVELHWLAPERAGAIALERARRDATHRADLLRFLALRDGQLQPEDLQDWDADPDPEVALWASVALFKRAGAAGRVGLPRVLAALKTGEQPLLLDWLFDDLWALGEGDVRTWLRSLPEAAPGQPAQPTTLLLQRLLFAGEPAARDRLLAQLGGTAPPLLASAQDPFWAGEHEALRPLEGPRDLSLLIARWGDFWPEDAWKLTPEREAQLLARAKAWVQEEARRVQDGLLPRATREEPAAPLGPWRSAGGRWILQTR